MIDIILKTWFLFSGTLSPAYPAPELYLAPQFDEFGAPLPPEDLEYDYNDDIFDEVDDIPAEPLRDFGSGSGLIPTNFRGGTSNFLKYNMYILIQSKCIHWPFFKNKRFICLMK